MIDSTTLADGFASMQARDDSHADPPAADHAHPSTTEQSKAEDESFVHASRSETAVALLRQLLEIDAQLSPDWMKARVRKFLAEDDRHRLCNRRRSASLLALKDEPGRLSL